MDHTVKFSDGFKRAELVGIEHGDLVVVWKPPKALETGEVFVLKNPGQHYWASMGTTKYAPAEFMVMSVERVIGVGASGLTTGMVRAKTIVEFPVRKKA
jgi:hypothetical protein